MTLSYETEDEPRCIPQEDLEISKQVIGRGAFATVFKALLADKLKEGRLPTKDVPLVEVAVKVRQGASDAQSR